MAIAQKEKVLVIAIHIKRLGLMAQHFEEQRSKIIGTTEGAARVAALNGMHHSYNISSYLAGYLRQCSCHAEIEFAGKAKVLGK